MNYLRLMIAAVLGTAVLFSGTSVQAEPLFDFLDPNESGISDDFSEVTLGYTFTVNEDVTVDGIGLFDYGSDGLSSAHQVALWNMDGSFRIDPMILNPGLPPANSEVSISGLGSYIYVGLDQPLILEAGEYVLGASYLAANGNKDPVEFLPDSITENAPNVFFGAGVFGAADGVNVMFPDIPGFGNNYFGPALRISATIPEPLTLALLFIGIVGMAGNLRQRSRLGDSIAA